MFAKIGCLNFHRFENFFNNLLNFKGFKVLNPVFTAIGNRLSRILDLIHPNRREQNTRSLSEIKASYPKSDRKQLELSSIYDRYLNGNLSKPVHITEDGYRVNSLESSMEIFLSQGREMVASHDSIRFESDDRVSMEEKNDTVNEELREKIYALLFPESKNFEKVLLPATVAESIYKKFAETYHIETAESSGSNHMIRDGRYKITYPIQVDADVVERLDPYQKTAIHSGQIALQKLKLDEVISYDADGAIKIADQTRLDQMRHYLNGLVTRFDQDGGGFLPEIGIMQGVKRDEIFIVSPLALGSLKDVMEDLKQRGEFSDEVRVEIMRQVIASVKELQLKWGYIHHDIDPSNFLVLKDANQPFGFRVILSDPDFVTSRDPNISVPKEFRVAAAPLEFFKDQTVNNYISSKYDLHGIGNILLKIFDDDRELIARPFDPNDPDDEYYAIRENLNAEYFHWERFHPFVQVMIKGLQHPDSEVRFSISQADTLAENIEEYYDNQKLMDRIIDRESEDYQRLMERNREIKQEFIQLDTHLMQKNDAFQLKLNH